MRAGLTATQQASVTVSASRSDRARALKLTLAAFGRSLGTETVDAIGGRLGSGVVGFAGPFARAAGRALAELRRVWRQPWRGRRVQRHGLGPCVRSRWRGWWRSRRPSRCGPGPGQVGPGRLGLGPWRFGPRRCGPRSGRVGPRQDGIGPRWPGRRRRGLGRGRLGRSLRPRVAGAGRNGPTRVPDHASGHRVGTRRRHPGRNAGLGRHLLRRRRDGLGRRSERCPRHGRLVPGPAGRGRGAAPSARAAASPSAR